MFGQPFWPYLDASPEISAAFDQAMAAGSSHSYWSAIADGFDWSAATHVVDVGGGTGTLRDGPARREVPALAPSGW